MIKAGCGDLVLGYMKGHGLVSSALFTDFGDISHYAVAVYNRELFAEKPLGHAVTFEGILRAKERGQRLVNMGVIEQKGHVSDKEYNIGLFKKGFSNTLGNHIEWMFSIA
jgi:lipid II:glycine glycyltransferase (peptidoglycan interpeptide bridge formation enzyme)